MTRSTTSSRKKISRTKPKRFRFPILFSYWYAKSSKDGQKVFEELRDHPDVELLVDSGAFSALNSGAEIDLKEYIAWLKEHEDGIDHAIALDVLGNPEKTDRNLQVMLDAGIVPVPVHVLGDDQERMDYLFEQAPYVALGGLRRPHRGWAPKSYVAEKMKWADGRPVHWLGYTKAEMFTRFRPHSCDAANINASAVWGWTHCYLGDNRWMRINRKKFMAGRLPLDPRVCKISDLLGIKSEDWFDDKQWRRNKTVQGASYRVTSYSFLLYSLDVFAKTGVRYYNALSESRIIRECLELINAVKENNAGLCDRAVRRLSPVEDSTG